MNNITNEFLASVSFRPFNNDDWQTWQGCESAFPLIGEKDDMTIIVDGNSINVYDEDFNGFYASLNEGRNLSWNKI